MASSLSLYGILDSNILIDLIFVDWLRNLKIMLIQKKISYILDALDPKLVRKDATEDEVATYKIWQNDSLTVKYIKLSSMSNELSRKHEAWILDPYCSISKSCMVNRVELLGMKYLAVISFQDD